MTNDSPCLLSVVIPCFRDSARAAQLVGELRSQVLPAPWSREIIVVDDGSGAPHDMALLGLAGHDTTVVTLPGNAGRSTAVARGIDRARGELLMVMDSDCLPGNDGLLAAHIHALSSPGVVASNGPVRGHDGRFWSRYQDDVMTRRARGNALQGTVGSTANCCMKRQSYLAVGGFDRDYTGYGFEDRDLLLRLAAAGSIAWTPLAVVRHMDELSLQGVCRKVSQAGQGNAGLFSRRHPEAYRALGYARFDARGRPGLAFAGRAIAPVIPAAARVTDQLLEYLPFPLGRLLVKVLSALAFLAGSSRAGS